MQGPIVTVPGLFMVNKLLQTAFDLKTQDETALLNNLITNYGVALQRNNDGTYSTQGLVGTSGPPILTIKAFDAIVKDTDGIVKAINVLTDQTFDTTGYANGTYSLAVQNAPLNLEVGTITLSNGSATVNGVGTKFTQRLDKNLALVIQGSHAGNNGVYPILSVTSDTVLVLQTVFGGTTEAGLQFSAGGFFPYAGMQPGSTAAFQVYEFNNYQFVFTTAALTSSQLCLATVIKGTGSLSITDARVPLKLRPHTHLPQDISGSIPQQVVKFTFVAAN